MKLAIRFTLFGVGMLLALLALSGCFGGTDLVAEVPSLTAFLSPSTGHPDFKTAVIVEDKDGGTYTYEATGQAAVQSAENEFKTIVDQYPWKCVVTWTDGIDVATTTVRAGLENEGPVVNKPRIIGWQGIPGSRTMVDCRYWSDKGTGIYDPEGDDWTMTNLVIKCDENTKPDTMFYPSIYGIKDFHVDVNTGCDTKDIYPAAIWYPTYAAAIEGVSNLPYSLRGHDGVAETGYPAVKKSFRLPLQRKQEATITISAEDEYGASTTRIFTIPIKAYSVQTISSTAFDG